MTNETGGPHPIQLKKLLAFKRRMVSAGVRRESFSYKANRGRLEVAYLIDVAPNVLIIGVAGVGTYAFEVEVSQDCFVTPYLGRHYGRLLDALGVEKGENPFRTVNFFRELDSYVPNRPPHRVFTRPDLVARTRGDVEEADKVYFVGWVAHGDDRHVTSENLRKTFNLLGADAANSCRRNNVSSRWAAVHSQARQVTSPPRRQVTGR